MFDDLLRINECYVASQRLLEYGEILGMLRAHVKYVLSYQIAVQCREFRIANLKIFLGHLRA